MPKLIIDEASAKIIDELIMKAKETKHGLITNWDMPYGISFDELDLIGDRMKYGEDFVIAREYQEARRRIEELEQKGRIKNKGFLDIKVEDVIIAYDEYSHDYNEHYFKVTNIEYDDEYSSENNPQGMRCFGIDLDCWDETTQDYDCDDYIGVVDISNFVGFKKG